MRALLLVSSLAALLAACASSPSSGRADSAQQPDDTPPAADPQAGEPVAEELAPIPFPHRELAAAYASGDSATYRMEEAGKEPYLRITTFTEVDDEGATMEVRTTDLEGAPTGEPTSARASWQDLEHHGHFPARATTITETEVDVPAGRFDALLYEVRTEQAGPSALTRLWFVESMPGPPVKLIQELDGDVILRMELVDATAAP